jgi:hypothetical protein
LAQMGNFQERFMAFTKTLTYLSPQDDEGMLRYDRDPRIQQEETIVKIATGRLQYSSHPPDHP